MESGNLNQFNLLHWEINEIIRDKIVFSILGAPSNVIIIRVARSRWEESDLLKETLKWMQTAELNGILKGDII